MLFQIVLFIAGLVLLYYGANFLVKGASNISILLGIKPIVVGLTVVAFGTSAPEFVASLLSALKGINGIAIGNVVGSNIANIGLVLGLTAIISPLKVRSEIIKRDAPFMIASTILFFIIAINGTIGRLEGIIFFILIIAYTIILIKSNKDISSGQTEKLRDEVKKTSKLLNIIFTIGGLGGLVVGANFVVNSAVFIARNLGLSEFVIGVTIVAVGTSLPEISTSLVSAIRKESDLSIGNAIGSNIFNILFIIGSVAIITPLKISTESLKVDFPVMTIFAIGVLPLLIKDKNLNRIEGIILLIGYIFYVIWII